MDFKSDQSKHNRRLRLSTIQIVALGFLGVILIGAFLLWLPPCNQRPIPFLDALFTAVTSVCVTGLVTVVPAQQFTFLGKCILLLLIQIGGLGIIACTSAFFLILGKRISMKGRIIIQQAYGLDTLSGMVRFMIRVLKGTFVVEGIGAILFAFQFVPEYGWKRGIGYSIFHSISAFCNAGIDLLGDSSFLKYTTNPLVNFTCFFLVILSGLGFPVWYDIYQNTIHTFRENMPRKRLFTKLSTQSKLVLTMTGLLLLLGTFGFLLFEYTNPKTMADLSFPQKLMAATFQSVTTRTAGFASISQSGLTESSRLLGCILMFVGGSPAGTAGGVKTTTVAMLLLTVLCVLRGKKDTECFGRKIDASLVRSGITIVLLTFTFWLCGVSLLTILEPDVDFLNLMYEAMSAMATVGLTADLTPSLSQGSHIVLIVLMYIGRIGPLTMALLFSGKADKASQFRELPEKKIMIG